MAEMIKQWNCPIRPGLAYAIQVSAGTNQGHPSHAIALVDWMAAPDARIPLPHGSDEPWLQTRGPLKRLFLDRVPGGWSGIHIAPAQAVLLRVTLFHWNQFGPRGNSNYSFSCQEAISPRRCLRVGVAHQRAALPATMESNRDILLDTIADAGAKGIALLCTSETFISRCVDLPLKQTALAVDDPFLQPIYQASKDNRVHLVFSFHEKKDGGIFNSSVLVADDGQRMGTYRKRHLAMDEYEVGLLPGDSWPVFETRLARIGLQVCWDAWYVEGAAALAAQKAEIICLSIAGDADPQHWDSVWRARALDNGVYWLASTTNNCGGTAPSRLIAPDGRVLAETRHANSIVSSDIELPFPGQRLVWTADNGPCFSDYHNVVEHLRLSQSA